MYRFIYCLLGIILLQSCEDVIEVDLPTETSRLSVDAVLRMDTSEPITTAQIKLNLTSSFFEENNPLSNAEVRIRNLDFVSDNSLESNEINLAEVSPGTYEATRNTTFFTSGQLALFINFKNEQYYATTSFVPTSPIESVVQGEETLFTGDETEIIISFTDDGTRDDFYIFDFGFNEFLVTEDEFYQGQRFEFSYFYEDIEPGQEMTISILGADESFYNYMNQIIVQAGGDQGPFQTPAATVRGNIFNVTGIANPEELESIGQNNDFPLGYFAVVQEFKRTIEIE
ncbi:MULTISPECIES: DUF4249 family protein [Maribacter]|uniref:DUF4249 family protein n=1 Tax=Maribacter flavus TaxID=1658664 RepID=A0A5B2TRJ0_9FLAO|nr:MULTISPECIES: DUF4249 family protein [Maribacter]KAA2216859.1 DUF4249 family protein [Maribacter flavus]MDC6406002.1 DUF4249 family protein [Maribacter sp. PR66]MEE1973213.1 DUF4249 family protein [Maribacter flavus]